jgi:DNA polymerase elongation subunit (family B)
MKEFFQAVLIESDVHKATKLTKDAYWKVRNGHVGLQEIAIPKGITKGTSHLQKGASPWIRGKENGRVLLNIRFHSSKKPKLLYCLKHPDVICIDNDTLDADVLRVAKVDYQTMATKVVEMKMKSLLESIGVNWEQAVLGQTGLGKWCET